MDITYGLLVFAGMFFVGSFILPPLVEAEEWQLKNFGAGNSADSMEQSWRISWRKKKTIKIAVLKALSVLCVCTAIAILTWLFFLANEL